MDFRLYQSRDFDALYAVEELCFEPPERFSRSTMRRLIQQRSAATWIAEDEKRLCGFGVVDWRPDAGRLVAYIQTVEVRAEMRGLGVGGELLRRMEGSASDAGAVVIWLHVNAENATAIRLYEAHGYKCEGRQENYYGPEQPALIFAREPRRMPAGDAEPAWSPE